MRLIDPTKTRVQVEETEHGRNIRYTEHHDGRVDADVKVRSLRLSLTSGAPPDRRLVDAIHELEEATKEHRIAKSSGSVEWARFARDRVAAANDRVREVQ